MKPYVVTPHLNRLGDTVLMMGHNIRFKGVVLIKLSLYPFLILSTVVLCFSGVTDYLQTEISTSKQKKFSLVTFVDTPGLVDGDMKYPFDVNEAILWLGKYQWTLIVRLFIKML